MPKVIAMLLVHNDADRYLVEVLNQLNRLADAVVICDDASTDATGAICQQLAPVHYARGNTPQFAEDEPGLRQQLWRRAAALQPDWVLALDSDELFEDAIFPMLPRLLDQRDYDAVAFRIFDFWKSDTQVRTDGAWNPWGRFTTRLVRYDPALPDTWRNQPLHGGFFPLAYDDRVICQSHVRLRHDGWARAEEHQAKYQFYRERDLRMRGQEHPHTASILQSNVRLEPWIDQPIPDWLAGSEGPPAAPPGYDM